MPTLSPRSRDCVLVPKETYFLNGLVQIDCLGPLDTYYVLAMLLIKHFGGFDFNVNDGSGHTLETHFKLVKTHGWANYFSNANVTSARHIYPYSIARLECP